MPRPRLALLGAAAALTVTACAPPDAPAAPAPGTAEAALAPWIERQDADGAFPGWVGHGGAGGYAESMLGLALATHGAARDDRRALAAGERALRWALRHPATETAGMPSIFEELALATALDTLAEDLDPALVARLRARVAATPRIEPLGARFSNRAATDALRLVTAAHAGAAPAPADLAYALRVLGTDAPREARRHARGAGSVLSDPPANPLAYHGLTLGLLARATELLGADAPPALRRTVVRMARGSTGLVAPDGDVAYWGRSQEQAWALSMTAYGARVAVRLAPGSAPRLRRLAAATLARLRTHHDGPDGLAIVPALAEPRAAAAARAGLDSYAAKPSYVGLAAVGLLWAAQDDAGGPAAGGGLSGPLGARLHGGSGSRFATVRTPDAWFAVKRRSTYDVGDDWRTDFGLVAFKVRAGTGWRDALPLRPYDFHGDCDDACRTPPPTAGPALRTGEGVARPVGDAIRVRGTEVTIRGRYVLPDGRTAARLRARWRPTRGGVQLTTSAPAGATVELTGLFDEAGGRVCTGPSVAGNRLGTLWLPGAVPGAVRTGLASGSQARVAAVALRVRATGRPVVARWSAAGAPC